MIRWIFTLNFLWNTTHFANTNDKISTYEQYLAVHLDKTIESAIASGHPFTYKSNPQTQWYSLADKSLLPSNVVAILSSFSHPTPPQTARLFAQTLGSDSDWMEIAKVKLFVYQIATHELHGVVATPIRNKGKRPYDPTLEEDRVIEISKLYLVVSQ